MDDESTKTYGLEDLSELLGRLDEEPLRVAEEPTEDLVDSDLVRDLSAGRYAPWDEPETEPGFRRAVRPGPPSAAQAEVTRRVGDALPRFSLERQIRMLKHEAEAAVPAQAAVLYHELGRIYESRLDRPDEALRWYRESLRSDPKASINLRALSRLLIHTQEHGAALEVLEAELAAATTPQQRAAVLTERARVKRDLLADPQGGVDELQEARGLDPADPVVADLLAGIYRDTGAFAALDLLWRERIASWDDPALRSSVLCDLARSCEDGDRAAALYREALEVLPGNTYALRALLRAAKAGGDQAEAASLLERLAELERGPVVPASLAEAARIYADQLDQLDPAIRCLQRACELRPDDIGLCRDLAHLLERAERWSELAASLEATLKMVGDPQEGSVLAHRLARARLEHLDDRPGAIRALKQAVELCPEHTAARRMLGRLYQQDESYEALALLLTQELEHFGDPERRGVTYYRLGRLREQRLGDLSKAASAYERSLALLPGYRPAIHGMERVLSGLERQVDLVAVYERSIASLRDQGEKIRILGSIAAIWEHQLHDGLAALTAYERLLAIDPTNLHALQGARRLYARYGRWQDLVGTLRAEATRSQNWRWCATLLQEIAEIQEYRLEDHGAALATYLELLDWSPGYPPALDGVVRLLERAEDWPRLRQLLRRELERCVDSQKRAWLLVKVARLLEERLDAPTEAAALYVEAMSQSSELQIGVDQVIRLYRGDADATELLPLLLRLPPPGSPVAQALHHRRIAEVMLRTGQPRALVEERLRRALSASGDDDATLQLLLRSCRSDPRRLVDIYQLATRRSEGASGTLCRLAWLLAGVENDLEQAVAALQQVRTRHPKNTAVLQQLRWMLHALGRWEALAEVVGVLLDLCPQEDYQIGCALERAELLEQLGDLDHAVPLAKRVVAANPSDLEALGILERLHRSQRDAVGLADVLGRYCAMAQTVPERVALLVAMASLQANSGELRQSLTVLQAATTLQPDSLAAARALSHVTRLSGNTPQAAQALEREAGIAQDPAHGARCLVEAAEIWLEAGDEERSIAAYRRALEVVPDDARAVEALKEVLLRRGEADQIVELLRQAAARAEEPGARVTLLAHLAELLLDSVGDRDAARQVLGQMQQIPTADAGQLATLAALFRRAGELEAALAVDRRLHQVGEAYPSEEVADDKEVVELGPEGLDSLERLSAVLIRQENWVEAARTLEVLVTRRPGKAQATRLYLQLAEVRAEGLNDLAGAVEACRKALALEPDNVAISDQLNHLLGRLDEKSTPEAAPAAARGRDRFQVAAYRDLCELFDRQERSSHSYVVRSLLLAIGAANEEDRRFVERWRTTYDRAPSRPLTGEEVEGLIHPEEQAARRALLAIGPVLREAVLPLEATDPAARRFTARSHPELTAILERLAQLLGGVRYRALMLGGAEPLRVDDTDPATLYLNRELQALAETEVQFQLARLLAQIRLHHPLPARLGVSGLSQVLAALGEGEPSAPPGEIYGHLRQRLAAWPGRPESVALEPERWLEVMAFSADRLALAVCGDVQAAVRAVARDEIGRGPGPEDLHRAGGPRLKHLMAFATDEAYLTLRDALAGE